MTTDFDPAPDGLYAACVTCNLDLATEAESDAHRTATMADSADHRSHTTRTLNPPRTKRIESAVETIVIDAIDEALDKIDDLVSSGSITQEEARAALHHQGEFLDAWDEYVQENA